MTYDGQKSEVIKAGSYAFGPALRAHAGSCASAEPCLLFIALRGRWTRKRWTEPGPLPQQRLAARWASGHPPEGGSIRPAATVLGVDDRHAGSAGASR